VILPHHSPDYIEEASRAGFDPYFAGHTHGGQVRIPGYGAILVLSKYGKRYEAGLYSRDRTWMYVNRGSGSKADGLPACDSFAGPRSWFWK